MQLIGRGNFLKVFINLDCLLVDPGGVGWACGSNHLSRFKLRLLRKIDAAAKLYDTVILPMSANDDEEFLNSIDDKSFITLFANAGCALTCPSKICYPSISKANKENDASLFQCSQKLKYRELLGMQDFDLDYLQSLGFSRFKLLRSRRGAMTGH